MSLSELKPKIAKILRKNGIKKAGIFGSFTRNEQKKGSDVDILIEFRGSLLKLIRIERELENKIKIKVDLLTYNGINPLLKERILQEEERII
ncbi:MAG: nucleotidyltransferase family protein [Nanoarchaeota archaeon]|nr:nucleotidyltransferase family protein [Nanoarchaeota archaeon]MBU4086336.1 nucleotidyltransferase family protein [Nanoarchaeota archaeon]